MNRAESIMFAYEDCARAVYQSWGVIGLGLSAFMFSGFTPTQRFGVLMPAMLTVSSIGNLVLLPALLASPLGNFFWKSGQRVIRKKQTAHLHVPAEQQPAVVHAEREDSSHPQLAVHTLRPAAADATCVKKRSKRRLR